MRLEQQGLVRIGQWSENYFIREKPLTLGNVQAGPLLSGQTLRVITAFNKPYTMLKNSSKELFGNDRYEGYVVDLISELSKVLQFDYELIIYPTKQYGSCKSVSGCDGMLGTITRGETDLAIVDLTITAERQSAVDFSLPFMTTGIGVLYFKITKEKISLFSFMNPFSLYVWLCLILLTSLAALCLHIMGRISPYEVSQFNIAFIDHQVNVNYFSYYFAYHFASFSSFFIILHIILHIIFAYYFCILFLYIIFVYYFCILFLHIIFVYYFAYHFAYYFCTSFFIIFFIIFHHFFHLMNSVVQSVSVQAR